MILDLSSPEVHSVNDGTIEASCFVPYVIVEDTVKAVIKKGQVRSGAVRLAKVDISNAYNENTLHFSLTFTLKIFTSVHGRCGRMDCKVAERDSVLRCLDDYI